MNSRRLDVFKTKKIMGTGMNYINTSCVILSIIPIFETDEIKEVINYTVLISN